MANPYTQGSESITQAEHISPDKTGDNIQAKRVALYIWNGTNWERSSNSSPILDTKIDTTTTSGVTYIGKAPLGSSETDAVWQIKKLDTNTIALDKTWGASGAYTCKWTERATAVVYT